jgi:hypothetical protein
LRSRAQGETGMEDVTVSKRGCKRNNLCRKGMRVMFV